jgi:hypothetical protein
LTADTTTATARDASFKVWVGNLLRGFVGDQRTLINVKAGASLYSQHAIDCNAPRFPSNNQIDSSDQRNRRP